jgi:hypothetical protein
MRRAALLLGLPLVVSLSLAPAAGADVAVTQSSAAFAANAPPPPVYELERDGTVIRGGDVVTDCEGFLAGRAQGYGTPRYEAEAQAVADTCRGLGVPSDFQTGNSPVILSLGTEGPPATNAGELPETGGLSLNGLAGLASGFVLISGGLLLRRIKG